MARVADGDERGYPSLQSIGNEADCGLRCPPPHAPNPRGCVIVSQERGRYRDGAGGDVNARCDAVAPVIQSEWGQERGCADGVVEDFVDLDGQEARRRWFLVRERRGGDERAA